MSDELVRVARTDEVIEGKSKLVRVGNEEIALWRIDGRIHALNNVCPHQHFSKLHEGKVDDGFIVCPMHGWAFSVKDGAARSGSGRATVYHVRVIGESVYVSKAKDSSGFPD